MKAKELVRMQMFLDGRERVSSVSEARKHEGDTLLLPENIGIEALPDSNVITRGLGQEYDKPQDLMRIIEPINAIAGEYREENVLSPRIYLHMLENIPWHITTQAILVTRIGNKTKKYIRDAMRGGIHYGKHEMDCLWLPCSKKLWKVSRNDTVCIFNRRVSGWDGSEEKPVIELLGAGGHLQTVWDDAVGKYISRPWNDNLRKEFDEEIGLKITDEDITFIGGFVNQSTNELVLLFCLFVAEEKISAVQTYALGNVDEDTDGIYLGTMKETLEYYRSNPGFFAGGAEAAKTNFPNNVKIMERLNGYIKKER
ncbi:MAG: hypothetical protein IKS43_00430 [Clostridia bacterium]|nr:hypothetical protein [Clostridia bacterium]